MDFVIFVKKVFSEFVGILIRAGAEGAASSRDELGLASGVLYQDRVGDCFLRYVTVEGGRRCWCRNRKRSILRSVLRTTLKHNFEFMFFLLESGDDGECHV